VTTINNWKHRGIVKLRRLVGGSMDASIPAPANDVIGMTRTPASARRPARERVDLSADLAPRANRRRGERFAPESIPEIRPDPRRQRGHPSAEEQAGEERREGA
jgi:hypothetical protein